MTTVGYIGLGAMGLPLARHLTRKGFDVIVYDIDPARADAIVELGGRKAFSVAEAAQGVDVVVTCLPATPHVDHRCQRHRPRCQGLRGQGGGLCR
jgi:4-hydroxybutyrate dehydrogenase/sulfolactaldehyde 3-reductase